MNPVHIAIDLMGGDHGPSVIIPAVQKSLSEKASLHVTLLGREEAIAFAKKSLTEFSARTHFIVCDAEVSMEDKPSSVLRQKQNSSLYQAVEQVAQGAAQACLSAGNTGAFMACGYHLLKLFTGIERPAVCAEMPTEQGQCLMLDLGANVDCSAEQLYQFALLGSVLSSVLYGIASPKVSLLNNGAELGKGNQQVKTAAELLKSQSRINYCGFVEGDDIFRGSADVVVCDGFVGNAVLKASEGAARLIQSKLSKVLDSAALEAVARQINPSHYNGATLIGLQGVVVVSHGNVDSEGFCSAIRLACKQVENDLSKKIELKLIEVLV